MTLIIVTVLLLSYLLIATENITKVNKAAVAIFACAVGWVLYICYGTDFVMSQHEAEYFDFLGDAKPTSVAVKNYIAENVFLKYVGKASEIVLFLLSTMTIVEILNNNGCFDFITQLLRTRKSQRILWTLSIITFLISANLDNLTTTVMMLMIMRKVIPNRRHRMIFGSAIVVAANCGGMLTVIGDPAGLVIWNMNAVTATSYSMHLLLPVIVVWLLPTWWLGRSLPERIDIEWQTMPYRGDDTNLNVWQRLIMLFLGIGGLWFIPSFHSITKLSPFLGAVCVLAVLWVVHEIFNRKLLNADQMTLRRMPRVLQYGTQQMILFVMGIMLAIGVVNETGALNWASSMLDQYVHNVWVVGIITGLVSTILDNFATAMTMFSLYDVNQSAELSNYAQQFAQNGIYWEIIAFAAAAGGNVLSIGSMSGLALMKAERVKTGWYFKNVGLMSMLAGVIGLGLLYAINMI